MHNSHQSFASRKRMLNLDGDASNQVIWFTDARPAIGFDQTPQALAVIDEWMANIRANPAGGVVREQACGRGRLVLLHERRAARVGRRRLGRDPRLEARGRVHAAVPALLDVADRRRRADRGRDLQVRAPAGRRGGRGGAVRAVDPVRLGRGSAASRSSRRGSATTRSRTSAGRRDCKKRTTVPGTARARAGARHGHRTVTNSPLFELPCGLAPHGAWHRLASARCQAPPQCGRSVHRRGRAPQLERPPRAPHGVARPRKPSPSGSSSSTSAPNGRS